MSALALMLWACHDPPGPAEAYDYTNRWWYLVDREVFFFMEDPVQHLWWSEDLPSPSLYDNASDGVWAEVGPNRFSIEMYGAVYRIRAGHIDDDGCYPVRMMLYSDTACPWGEP